MRLCRVWPIYPFKKHIPAHPKTTGHQLFLPAAELTPTWEALCLPGTFLCGGCLHPHQFPYGVPREGIYPPSPGPVPHLPQLGVRVRPCESSPSVLMATTGAPVCHSLGSAAELTRKRWMRAPCGEHEAPLPAQPRERGHGGSALPSLPRARRPTGAEPPLSAGDAAALGGKEVPPGPPWSPESGGCRFRSIFLISSRVTPSSLNKPPCMIWGAGGGRGQLYEWRRGPHPNSPTCFLSTWPCAAPRGAGGGGARRVLPPPSPALCR